MKKIMVVTAGLVLALGPTGTAFAGETGNGKAYGNCQNSSAGGEKLTPDGSGNGGLREVTRAGTDCTRTADDPWKNHNALDFG